nr:AlNc14C32G2978 [Albugo laibachii Nc14]|eukprot:CCA17283.1 AlNc14C32G2978 [Albugo laibachii Nc14]
MMPTYSSCFYSWVLDDAKEDFGIKRKGIDVEKAKWKMTIAESRKRKKRKTKTLYTFDNCLNHQSYNSHTQFVLKFRALRTDTGLLILVLKERNTLSSHQVI